MSWLVNIGINIYLSLRGTDISMYVLKRMHVWCSTRSESNHGKGCTTTCLECSSFFIALSTASLRVPWWRRKI